jgi:hypothetical protein
MLGQTLTQEQILDTVQETRYPSYVSSSYMLLLSAIGKGWQVDRIEVTPSWDQHGFIYLVTLSYLVTLNHPVQKLHQQIILPKNSVVESLLFTHSTDSLPAAV